MQFYIASSYVIRNNESLLNKLLTIFNKESLSKTIEKTILNEWSQVFVVVDPSLNNNDIVDNVVAFAVTFYRDDVDLTQFLFFSYIPGIIDSNTIINKISSWLCTLNPTMNIFCCKKNNIETYRQCNYVNYNSLSNKPKLTKSFAKYVNKKSKILFFNKSSIAGYVPKDSIKVWKNENKPESLIINEEPLSSLHENNNNHNRNNVEEMDSVSQAGRQPSVVASQSRHSQYNKVNPNIQSRFIKLIVNSTEDDIIEFDEEFLDGLCYYTENNQIILLAELQQKNNRLQSIINKIISADVDIDVKHVKLTKNKLKNEFINKFIGKQIIKHGVFEFEDKQLITTQTCYFRYKKPNEINFDDNIISGAWYYEEVTMNEPVMHAFLTLTQTKISKRKLVIEGLGVSAGNWWDFVFQQTTKAIQKSKYKAIKSQQDIEIGEFGFVPFLNTDKHEAEELKEQLYEDIMENRITNMEEFYIKYDVHVPILKRLFNDYINVKYAKDKVRAAEIKLNTLELRGWQKQIHEWFTNNQSNRKILSFFSIQGALGKSELGSFIESIRPLRSLHVDNPKNPKYCASFMYNSLETLIIDFPRAKSIEEKIKIYEFLESVKNGRVVVEHYEARNLRFNKDKVKIIVFDNAPPDFNAWSPDRYEMKTMDFDGNVIDVPTPWEIENISWQEWNNNPENHNKDWLKYYKNWLQERQNNNKQNLRTFHQNNDQNIDDDDVDLNPNLNPVFQQAKYVDRQQRLRNFRRNHNTHHNNNPFSVVQIDDDDDDDLPPIPQKKNSRKRIREEFQEKEIIEPPTKKAKTVSVTSSLISQPPTSPNISELLQAPKKKISRKRKRDEESFDDEPKMKRFRIENNDDDFKIFDPQGYDKALKIYNHRQNLAKYTSGFPKDGNHTKLLTLMLNQSIGGDVCDIIKNYCYTDENDDLYKISKPIQYDIMTGVYDDVHEWDFCIANDFDYPDEDDDENDSEMSNLTKLLTDSIKCKGCLYGELNQEAHMGINGCLNSDDNEVYDKDSDNDEEDDDLKLQELPETEDDEDDDINESDIQDDGESEPEDAEDIDESDNEIEPSVHSNDDDREFVPDYDIIDDGDEDYDPGL